MAKLTIKRLVASCDKGFAYKIFVDGRERAKIREQKEVVLELEPGEHEIQARYFWLSSPTLVLDLEGDTTLHVRNALKGFDLVLSIPYAIIRPNTWIEFLRP